MKTDGVKLSPGHLLTFMGNKPTTKIYLRIYSNCFFPMAYLEKRVSCLIGRKGESHLDIYPV